VAVVRLVHIGLRNYVDAGRLQDCHSFSDVAVQRMVRAMRRQGGIVLDLTLGRRTRSVLVLRSGHVVLSPLTVDTLRQRLRAAGS